MKKINNLMVIITTFTLSLFANAESIRTYWDNSTWLQIKNNTENASIILSYQLKFWGDHSYSNGHPSNMLTASPLYIETYGVQDKEVEAQLIVCNERPTYTRVESILLSCYPSKILNLSRDSANPNHQWIELNSDNFDINTGYNTDGIKDIFLTGLFKNYSNPSDIFYYKSYQMLRLFLNGTPWLEQQIDMLAPIKK